MNHTINFPYDVKVYTSTLIRSSIDDTGVDCYTYSFETPSSLLLDKKYQEFWDKVELVAEVNCSPTFYRETHVSSNTNKISIDIPKSMVYHEFTIDVIIVFKEDIFWDGQLIRKGMPMAHLGSYKIDLEDRFAEGLIVFMLDEKLEETKNYFGNELIEVHIPAEQFTWLVANQRDPLVTSILSSQFAQIALIEACMHLKSSNNSHLPWYRELQRLWKEYDKNNSDFPEDEEIVQFVSHILKMPTTRLFEQLKVSTTIDN